MRAFALLFICAAARLHAQDTVNVESGGLKLRALLYRPSGAGPFPAVLYNHGSGQARNELQLKLLDSELNEIIAALALLRTRRDVDPQRIAIAGHSFGGSLTLLAAERDSTLRADVLFGAASVNWDGSPKLQQRLLDAVRHSGALIMLQNKSSRGFTRKLLFLNRSVQDQR